MTATVTELSLAPVKGMQVTPVRELTLGASGPTADRGFLVVDREHRLLLSSRTPQLLAIAPRWEAGVLTLRFPDGSEVAAAPELGERASTASYEGRPIHGRLVGGPFAEAVSAHLGRPVLLLAREADQRGADDAPVTLMSRASLAALAPALDGTVPDARRFRMTIAIDGVAAWEEHGWGGHEIAVGAALLRGIDPVPRCVVTTRDPERGETDAPVLKALAALRGKRDVTFGLWCAVAEPGRVRVGDPVGVLD